jgi:hypothetical protein
MIFNKGMAAKKTRMVYDELPMRFSPGLMNFEPELPVKKGKTRPHDKFINK